MANENGNGNSLKGLPSELIDELLAGRRVKGAYGKALVDFMEHSDELGVNPRDAWPLEFGTKSASSMYQSFRTSAKNAGILDQLTIMQSDDELYIIHNGRAAEAKAEVEA